MTVAEGDSVMDGALDNNIPGIIGQCGGGCTCCTCHCYVVGDWYGLLPVPERDELELLEFAIDPGPTSRLSCQIVVTEKLDGLTVRVPASQLPEAEDAGC